MDARLSGRFTRTALVAAAALFFIAGVGWAYFGPDIFLTAVMAGLAYCGF
jgi:hypothetical protein